MFSFTSKYIARRGHVESTGFTLIEVMVALFILTVGILSMISIISQVIGTVNETQNKVIAANLAQEGIEIVHNLRANIWLGGGTYNPQDFDFSGGCVDFDDSGNDQGCIDHTLYQDDAGVYSHNVDGTPTKFERFINMEPMSDSDGYPYVQVESVVSWDEENSITVESQFYDWL